MKLHYYPYELKLKDTFTVATYSRTTTPDVLVEIECDGLVGYGEASLPPYLGQDEESVLRFLGKVDLSAFHDPMRMDEVLDYVESLSEGDMAAKAAVDIALHDLKGKSLGLPCWQMFGKQKEYTPYTTFTIGIDTVAEMRRKTRACASKFRLLKVKLGKRMIKR